MIVFDIETTGTDPRVHSILSIGAIYLHDPAVKFFEECRMWNGAHVDHNALKINGYAEDEIKDPKKPEEGEIVAHFFTWLEARSSILLAGQNPMFDLGFIEASAGRHHINTTLAHRSIDLHSIVYMHMTQRGIEPPTHNKKSDINSDFIMNYVGIPTEPKPHVAINGAIWEAEAFSRLLYGRNLMTEFAKFPMPF